MTPSQRRYFYRFVIECIQSVVIDARCLWGGWRRIKKNATSYFVILAVVCFVIEHIARSVDREEQNSAASCYVVCKLCASSSNELKESLPI
jgi:hypothetical protein